MASAELLADRAETIGAEWVPDGTSPRRCHLVAHRVASAAGHQDVGRKALAVGYTPPLGAIPTIRDGMEVVRAASRSAGPA